MGAVVGFQALRKPESAEHQQQVVHDEQQLFHAARQGKQKFEHGFSNGMGMRCGRLKTCAQAARPYGTGGTANAASVVGKPRWGKGLPCFQKRHPRKFQAGTALCRSKRGMAQQVFEPRHQQRRPPCRVAADCCARRAVLCLRLRRLLQ